LHQGTNLFWFSGFVCLALSGNIFYNYSKLVCINSCLCGREANAFGLQVVCVDKFCVFLKKMQIHA